MAASRDFSDQDLRNRSFRGQDLTGADFSRSDLRGCDFRGATLVGATFERSRMGQSYHQVFLLSAIILVGAGVGIFSGFSGAFLVVYIVMSNLLFVGMAGIVVSMIAAMVFGVSSISIIKITMNSATFSAALVLNGFVAVASVGLGTGVIFFLTVATIAFKNSYVAEGILYSWTAVSLGLFSTFSMLEVFEVIRVANGTFFQEADLTDAIFRYAKVHNVTFKDAKIQRVDWEGSSLVNTDIRVDSTLSLQINRSIGCGGNYDNANFEYCILNNVRLQGASLLGANLGGAKFQGADLRGADLSEARAIGTDFSGSDFTGAVVRDWAVNRETQFKNICCDYVYLRGDRDPQSRKPLSGIFEPGDFEKIVGYLTETLDFLFHGEDDPRTYIQAIQTMRTIYGPQNIQPAGVENLGDGDRLFKFKTAPGLDKAKIHADTMEQFANLQIEAAVQTERSRQLESRLADEQAHRKFWQTFLQENIPKAFTSRDGDHFNINHLGTLGMSKQNMKTTGGGDISGIAGGDISGVAGKDIQGAAGRDLSGQVMLSIEALRRSDLADAPTLADLLTQLKATIDSSDLPDAAKAEAQTHLEQLAKAPTLPTAEGIKEAADKSIGFFKTISLIIPGLSEAINQLLGQIVNLCGWGG